MADIRQGNDPYGYFYEWYPPAGHVADKIRFYFYIYDDHSRQEAFIQALRYKRSNLSGDPQPPPMGPYSRKI